MKFVSVCSGVEAASLAFDPLGFTPAAFSEIDPFCCELLKQRFPGVPNLGDLTKWRQWDLPAAGMLIGGTPCQSFSVAGKRGSLSDARGNLALNFVELFHAGGFDFALWENVPGVLNTGDNAFGCFLGGLVGADGPLCEPPDGRWPGAGMAAGPLARIAWRILDAQHFGVAQRRRRVFVVASSRDAIDPVKILFEPKGLQRNPASRRKARADIAGALGTGASDGGGWRLGSDEAAANHIVPTLNAGANDTGGNRPPGTSVDTAESLVVGTLSCGNRGISVDQAAAGMAIPFDPIQITSGRKPIEPATRAGLSYATGGQSGPSYRLRCSSIRSLPVWRSNGRAGYRPGNDWQMPIVRRSSINAKRGRAPSGNS